MVTSVSCARWPATTDATGATSSGLPGQVQPGPHLPLAATCSFDPLHPVEGASSASRSSAEASAVAQAVGGHRHGRPGRGRPRGPLDPAAPGADRGWPPAGPTVDDPHGRPDAPVSTLPPLAEAWTLRANVSAADACYVVLAWILRCPLVTADRKLSGLPGWACRWSWSSG